LVSPFETTINKMAELGMFKFLFPFMLTAAVFYGLLRKSQIFGDPDRNVAVNGIVALIAGFMVWAYPIISGVDITLQLSNFFMQGLILTVTVMFALMIAGMFFPSDLSKVLNEKFKGGGFWVGIIAATILIAVIIVFTSGLFNTFFPTAVFGAGSMDQDTLMLIGTIVALIIGMVAIVGGGSAARGGEGEKKTGRKGEE